MTLILSPHSQVIGSAHCFTERNIWVKFIENRPKGRNTKFKGKSVTCDLQSR